MLVSNNIKVIKKYFSMKKLSIVCFICIFSIALVAQKTALPTSIKKGFTKQFPSASILNWEKLANQDYKLDFQENDKSSIVILDKDGQILFIKNKVDFEDLNIKIKKAIQNNQGKNYLIKTIYENISATRPSIFEVTLQVKKSKKQKKLTIDSQGNILKNLSK